MAQLNYKQRIFVSAYLDSSKAAGNATEAARIAGYSSPETYGSRVLAHPGVRAHIDAKLGSVALETAESLARVSEIASADIGDLIDVGEDGTSWSFNIAKAKRQHRTGVVRKLKRRVETRQDREGNPIVVETVEVEMYSKLDALDRLMRYHGLYKDRLDVTSNGENVKTLFYLPDNGRDPEIAGAILDTPESEAEGD